MFRTKLNELFVNENEVQSPIEYSDSEAIKRAVMAGLGISYLPSTLVRDEIANGQLAVIENGPLIQLRISLVHHKDKAFTVPMYALLLALANLPCADKTIKDLL